VAHLVHHVNSVSSFVRPDVSGSRVNRNTAVLLVLATSESLRRCFTAIKVVDIKSICTKIRNKNAARPVRSFKDIGRVGMSSSLSPVGRGHVFVHKLLAKLAEGSVLVDGVHES
jgi:hypothetical protein